MGWKMYAEISIQEWKSNDSDNYIGIIISQLRAS